MCACARAKGKPFPKKLRCVPRARVQHANANCACTSREPPCRRWLPRRNQATVLPPHHAARSSPHACPDTTYAQVIAGSRCFDRSLPGYKYPRHYSNSCTASMTKCPQWPSARRCATPCNHSVSPTSSLCPTVMGGQGVATSSRRPFPTEARV